MATPIPENHATFSLDEIARATGGEVVRAGESCVRSISTDSRTVGPGALFVALAGDTFDGHAHVAKAASAGASIALVERDVEAHAGMSVVRVASTLDALGDLARAHTRRWRAGASKTIVAITGSAGKTTTRVALTALAEALFPGAVLSSQGNLNNRVGVPMTLFCLASEHRVAIIEMGMNQPGEIAALASIAEPDVGVVTLVAAAHTEGVGSIEGVAHEKGALLRALGREGVALGNADDARVRSEMQRAGTRRRHLFGRALDADVRIVARTVESLTASRLVIERLAAAPIAFSTPLLGEAGAYACAAAIAVAEIALDRRVDADLAGRAFASADVGAGAGRLVPRVTSSGLAILDDSYNANPASMRASLAAAKEIAAATGRRLVLVLGEMRELGATTDAAHAELGELAVASGAAVLVAVLGAAKRTADIASRAGLDAKFAPDAAAGEALTLAAAGPGDLVLVKGSRGVGLERVVRALENAHGREVAGR